jgi:outer membrane murein-binding lipoprotein Lpp
MKTSMDRIAPGLRAKVPAIACVTLVAVAVALSAGCASSKGKGKIAKEIQNLPNGLVADTKDANHSDKTLQDEANSGIGE